MRKLTVGTEYGGHTVAPDFVNSSSIVYSFGIGKDASFDLGMMELFGCDVFAFDPTQASVEWIEGSIRNPKFHFTPIGLARMSGLTTVSKPSAEGHVSHYKLLSPRSDGHTETFDLRSLSDIMQELDHTRIDILKMDIEGFEYEVIDDILGLALKPKQILVEFHHKMFGFGRKDTRNSVSALQSCGYKLFHVSNSGHEYSFLLS